MNFIKAAVLFCAFLVGCGGDFYVPPQDMEVKPDLVQVVERKCPSGNCSGRPLNDMCEDQFVLCPMTMTFTKDLFEVPTEKFCQDLKEVSYKGKLGSAALIKLYYRNGALVGSFVQWGFSQACPYGKTYGVTPDCGC
jgi:hypothetical protein